MFKNVTLELSLKPFYSTEPEFIRKTCRSIAEQWYQLIKGRECVSVMLWVGDGSEMLDYKGCDSDSFEWCRFVGTANFPYPGEDEPKETSLHERKQDYRENAPQMTYGILKTIIKELRQAIGDRCQDSRVRIGETFDIGPEFAISDFKYVRHREICTGFSVGKFGFIDATACLNADSYPYAAFPEGIPEGLPFGRFLGRQAKVFLRDMGFDYLWLSNGLGFSRNPWEKTGKIFDGEKYYPEKLALTKASVFNFWQMLREECPDIPIETRGTNNTVGIDYASDGVPLYDIYNAGLGITAPPNSPWAAINDDFGLELAGHLSRVCELPSEVFPFRYYLHDPWWVNSPWYDRYDEAPSDIYLPMSLSRITKEGKTEGACSLGLLSIDNSYGGMPDISAREVIPHLMKAEKDTPDEPAPFVWVYPLREYTSAEDESMLAEMNLGDHLIIDAINSGFPLSGVVSVDNFSQHGVDLYKKSVLVAPSMLSLEGYARLCDFAKAGVPVILYGTDNFAPKESALGVIFVNVKDGKDALLEAAARVGYEIRSECYGGNPKSPSIMLSRSMGAMMFSVYNPNTASDTYLKFPLGAPILCGTETRLVDGYATYRFPRSMHKECRIFVRQKDGVISARAASPCNTRYRRKIRLSGLSDATVIFLPETGREADVSRLKVFHSTPVHDEAFREVEDEIYGRYIIGEHISGEVYLLFGR